MANEHQARTHMAPDEVPSSQQNVVADETQTGSARMAPDKVPSSWQKMVADETPTQPGACTQRPTNGARRNAVLCAFHTNAMGERMLDEAQMNEESKWAKCSWWQTSACGSLFSNDHNSGHRALLLLFPVATDAQDQGLSVAQMPDDSRQ